MADIPRCTVSSVFLRAVDPHGVGFEVRKILGDGVKKVPASQLTVWGRAN